MSSNWPDPNSIITTRTHLDITVGSDGRVRIDRDDPDLPIGGEWPLRLDDSRVTIDGVTIAEVWAGYRAAMNEVALGRGEPVPYPFVTS